MLIWCAGMYASGSTWLFNAVARVVKAVAPDSAFDARFVNVPADLDGVRADQGMTAIKSHDLPDPARDVLLTGTHAILVSLRDPRDAVASVMRYQRFPFPGALKLVGGSLRFCITLLDDPRTRVFRYEAGFPDDAATLDRIAAALGATLDTQRRTAIFAATRRAAIEQEIAGFNEREDVRRHAPSGDVYDPVTQWHRHHAGRSGEVGRWRRELTRSQVGAVEDALRAEMQRLEYVPERRRLAIGPNR